MKTDIGSFHMPTSTLARASNCGKLSTMVCISTIIIFKIYEKLHEHRPWHFYKLIAKLNVLYAGNAFTFFFSLNFNFVSDKYLVDHRH